MQQPIPIITLLTDYGEADAFVGTVKGVILSILPQARLIDLTHLIAPHDARQAAFILMTAAPFFPNGTVHLVVVDPGVGSARRAIAVETPQHRFVAPDNGVLSYALARAESYRAVALTNPAYRLPEVSSTFHGRDIFAPAAAHLAAGVPLEEFGPAVEDLVLLDPPRLILQDKRIEGEILNVDHFGNLRSSINALAWEPEGMLALRPVFASRVEGSPTLRFLASRAEVRVGRLVVRGISTTFSNVRPGRPLAYIGSEGGLEIAVNQGHAAREFSVQPGDTVTLIIR